MRSKRSSYRILGKAVERGDKKTVIDLLQNGVGVEESQLNNNDLLHSVIIKFNDSDIMTILLDKGANIHAKDKHNKKPLHVAIESNKTEAASLLIEKGALVGENLNPLLLTAVEKNNHTIFETLFNHKMQHNLSVDMNKLLNAAISQGNPKIIEHIIPHHGSSESTVKYIPRTLVIKSDEQCKESVELLLKWNFIIHPDNYNNEDFIYGAVENGHLPIVVDLLEHGIDVNIVNTSTGLNLITIACLNKHHEIVKKLLKKKANVNVKIPSRNKRLNENSCFCNNIHEFISLFSSDDHGNNFIDVTCLHIAVFNYDSMTTDILLKYGATITDDVELFNLTCIAAKNGCKKIVRKFLDHGVKVTDINSNGKSLLHFCVGFDPYKEDTRYEVVELLLKKGAHVHLETPSNSLVFEAIDNKHRKIAQLFLDYRPNVQYINPDGNTSLHAAIKYGFDATFIKTLITLKSPVDTANSDGQTPLLYACLHKSFKIVRAILKYEVDVDCADKNMMTPLHVACRDKNRQMIEALLEKDANPNAMDAEGQTSLHYICKLHPQMPVRIIKLLLNHGANVDAVDDRGWTPLFLACINHNWRAMSYLLDHHANINHADSGNSTPLHLVVEQTSVLTSDCSKIGQSIQLLLKNGANINKLNSNNQSALQIAVEAYHQRPQSIKSIGSCYFKRLMNCSKIIEILRTQVLKLIVAKLKVNEEDLKIVYDPEYRPGDNNIQQLSAQFEQEIDEMKREHMSVDDETDDVTLDDLLKKHDHFLQRFVENKDIQTILDQPVYDTKYPLYIDIIRSRFQNVKYRYKAIDSARKYFHRHVYQGMPDECVDIVFSYLSVVELKVFNEAIKPLNG